MANSGKERKENGGSCKELIEKQFVLLTTDVLGRAPEEVGDRTIEDWIPRELWSEAFGRFLEEWCPDFSVAERSAVCQSILNSDLKTVGLLRATEYALKAAKPNDVPQIDKMGMFQAVVRLVLRAQSDASAKPAWLNVLQSRLIGACQRIKAVVETSRMVQRRETGQQGVNCLVKDFLVRNPKRSGMFDVEVLLQRIAQDAESLGDDGVNLKRYVAKLAEELHALRADDKDVFDETAWKVWRRKLEAIRDNPLNPDVSETVLSEAPAESQPAPTGHHDSAEALAQQTKT